MDIAELADLYRQAIEAKDETVRNVLAQAVAQAAASRAALDAARATPVGRGVAEDTSAVRRLQLLLATQGANLRVDGRFGPETEKALLAFQAGHGLKADGLAGPQTWAFLGGGGDSEVAQALVGKADAELDGFGELARSAVADGDLKAAETLAAESIAAEAHAAEAIAAEALAAEAAENRFSGEPFAAEAALAEGAAAEGVAEATAALHTFVDRSAARTRG